MYIGRILILYTRVTYTVVIYKLVTYTLVTYTLYHSPIGNIRCVHMHIVVYHFTNTRT